ncbi:hypothetical protein F4561_005414 [Lipingzhangella halophila]|uniref:Uncharacterized protein n=1 Tax=Lipingzhangella halophila TaxID=1783352 RepID=A0A7W7RMB1_9ACTN|nr:hypothetical protein [Lipingzhangella halophila]MBB4934594.1 hypothetical protein [Lipingzhangella halophila]
MSRVTVNAREVNSLLARDPGEDELRLWAQLRFFHNKPPIKSAEDIKSGIQINLKDLDAQQTEEILTLFERIEDRLKKGEHNGHEDN